MKVIENKKRSTLIEAALGKTQCDLSIDNVKLVNVITGEIYPAGIDIIDGVIARVRMNGEPCVPAAIEQIDGEGGFLLPGFIDVHMHIESTMMIPENFGKAAVVWGTTTAVTDPHEIANVMGVDGVEFMIKNAKYSPLRIYTLAPSCVPAVPAVENAGASFTYNEVRELLRHSEVIGVAEIMDYLGVINNDQRMHDIVSVGLQANGFLQGHAPYVRGNDLCAYLCGGPVSDHEVRVAAELVEKLRMGMHVNIKSSSLSDTVQEFLKGIEDVPVHDFVSLCTDDVHAADLLTTGHINHIVNECEKNSTLNIVDVIRFGTINAARELHIDDLGIIAPNYIADMQIVDDLKFDHPPKYVFVEGKMVAYNGTLTSYRIHEAPQEYPNTVKIPQITSPNDFKIPSELGEQHLVFSAARSNMVPGQPLVYKEFPIDTDGNIILNSDEYQYLTIINRHGKGTMTKVVCSDFGLKRGCIASTISHDSHNMTIVYKNPEDAYIAAKCLEEVGGGMCYVENKEIKYVLPLPVAGLMSPLPVDELATKIDNMEEWVMYASNSPMLLAIAILALPVRPGIIITDMGVIRGETLQFVPLTKRS